MGRYLNSIVPLESYRSAGKGRYFVDKSELLNELIPAIDTSERFFCITRPRRFGKSTMANMIGAFFGKAEDSGDIFDQLSISKSKDYRQHRNKHNVIFIDFSEVPEKCSSYDMYITRILDGLKMDLCRTYHDFGLNPCDDIWDILVQIFKKTGEKFIFVMDEWDAVFHMSMIQDSEKAEYLLFLKNLLKDKVYVELAYMTGILPITKYSSGSELNMFLEYDMAMKKKFSEYFGFSGGEVDRLFAIYQNNSKNAEISREDLQIWYDGYYTARGEKLYNPRSVVCALTDNELANYWTSSGPYDEIFYYIRNNIQAVRDDLVLMIAGEGVKAEIQNYAAVSMELGTRDEIYSAMVVYGLLTYKDGKVLIPNREIMERFKFLLMSKHSLGYVHRLARESERMLKATFSGDTKTMAEILKYAHDTESPILSYNSEIELSAVVNLVYLAARDRYRVEREDKAGKGFVDFIFYPDEKDGNAILLELKVNGTPEEAISQIKEKNYALRLRGKLGEAPKGMGNILLVGICYDKKTKEHSCRVEWLN